MQTNVTYPLPGTATLSPPLQIERDQTGIGNEIPYFLKDTTESFAQSGIVVELQKQIASHIWETWFQSGRRPPLVGYLGNWSFPTVISIHDVELDTLKSKKDEVRHYNHIAQLRTVFDSEPVEDGVIHEAEIMLQEQFESCVETDTVLRELHLLVSDSESPSFVASILRCLGRNIVLGSRNWRIDLIRIALAQDNLEIRDAAVQTAELWGGPDMRMLLEGHSEPVSWLRDYINDVIEYLVD